MRLITRSDSALVLGLVVGAIVIFQQPLRYLLDVAADIGVRYHVDLVPALTIMTGAFIFHEYRKRQRAMVEARTAAVAATLAHARSAELERLMTFSQALANALDITTLQPVLWRYLPMFAREHDCWVLGRQGRGWLRIMQDTARTPEALADRIDHIADRAAAVPHSAASIEGVADDDVVCFPLRSGGAVVGILGVQQGTGLSLDDRRGIGAAAALIAIALRNVQLFGETREYSVRDALTGCFNRDHALTTLDGELRRAKRSAVPLSIVMFDVDRFKTINDELGHLQGDAILRALGAQLTRVLRSTDIRCRYGGDEFLLILPGTGIVGATQVAETLRKEIATLTVGAGHNVRAVTVSVGVTAALPDELDVAAILARADASLYEAKRLGRNRVSVAPAPVSSGASASLPDPQPASRPASLSRLSGTETILVVEDEPMIGMQIRRMLEPLGYTILSAASATDAIAIEAAHAGPIPLLLTDIIMPDLRGPELAQHIQARRPETRVLYVSGVMDPGLENPGDRAHPAGFLRKPFERDDLATKVREQLDLRPVDPATN